MNTPTAATQATEINQPLYESCLMPLLNALHWHGSERHLKEAAPHLSDVDSTAMFCDVMRHLNYDVDMLDVELNTIDTRLLPCLFVSQSGAVMVLLSEEEDEILAFDSEMNAQTSLALSSLMEEVLRGRIYTFTAMAMDKKAAAVRVGWMREIFLTNRSLIYTALGITFFLNIFALATPIYIMSVYDKVIGASSYKMLAEFTFGIGAILLGVYLLHRNRARVLAILGARLDRALGNKIFDRLLYLAPAYTETATVGSQVARIKDFDRLREFLSGPMLTVFFELPYIVIALTLVAILGGSLVLVPVTMLAIFFLLGLIMLAKIKRYLQKASQDGAQLQEFLLEAINNMRTLKYTAADKTWLERYRLLSANATLSSLKVSMIGATNTALSDAIMIASGMAVLSFGAIKIINATLSVGAMIAVMIFIWRVLGPLKAIFNSLPRLYQMSRSLIQINRLMSIAPEIEFADLIRASSRKVLGRIGFQRVSMRYHGMYTPALMGVSFEIEPGKVVAVVGRNGSGKSTILKLILGLYQPQAGSIRIDDRDIRQINPIELRKSIAYLPQTPELFYGSIAQNLRLANPAATYQEIEAATKQAGIYKRIMELPEKFDTPIRDFSSKQLASSFLQELCLARAYLKQASILLLDEPANVLDREADERLMQSINEMRGKTTVVIVTHRPSHLRMVDTVLLMEQGQLLIAGSPEEVLPKIPKELL